METFDFEISIFLISIQFSTFLRCISGSLFVIQITKIFYLQTNNHSFFHNHFLFQQSILFKYFEFIFQFLYFYLITCNFLNIKCIVVQCLYMHNYKANRSKYFIIFISYCLHFFWINQGYFKVHLVEQFQQIFHYIQITFQILCWNSLYSNKISCFIFYQWKSDQYHYNNLILQIYL